MVRETTGMGPNLAACVRRVDDLGRAAISVGRHWEGIGGQVPPEVVRRMAPIDATRPTTGERGVGPAPIGPPRTQTAPDGALPDARFQVLPSGVLAFRLPDSKAGKPVWLDTVHRVKLCEHGSSMAQIHHWRCAARPRAKPPWVECQCDAKGLYTDPKAKPGLLPADVAVPSYASVLWRDGAPTRLQPVDVLAVRVPGRPKGREVFIDVDGVARCPHGFCEGTLSKARRQRMVRAASQLQEWWRALDPPARASVRLALSPARRRPRVAEPLAAPSAGLQRAASVWRRQSERRLEDDDVEKATAASRKAKKKRGRPAVEPCGCRPGGLRREVFGTLQRRSRAAYKRARGDDAAEADGGRPRLGELSNRRP